jgi:hypothetical protein
LSAPPFYDALFPSPCLSLCLFHLFSSPPSACYPAKDSANAAQI